MNRRRALNELRAALARFAPDPERRAWIAAARGEAELSLAIRGLLTWGPSVAHTGLGSGRLLGELYRMYTHDAKNRTA